ncbi:MAG: IS200/IS605 family transposase, partial [Bacillota bacterium]|nr:IS200/IS605 family transposase [Bacillota bacterium]
MDYDRKSHCKCLILVHLIFVCKYRKKLLIEYGDTIKEVFKNISHDYDFIIKTMEVDKNHIHLLVKYDTSISILQIVRLLKQISTYRIWRMENSENLKNHFWKERTFW